jgi:hypothetical protein
MFWKDTLVTNHKMCKLVSRITEYLKYFIFAAISKNGPRKLRVRDSVGYLFTVNV